MELLQDMSSPKPTFDPFTGPLQDRNGVTRVPAGKTLTPLELNQMQWVAPGVTGPLSDEPK
jgi:simple sugar transport system substrate-binding protein